MPLFAAPLPCAVYVEPAYAGWVVEDTCDTLWLVPLSSRGWAFRTPAALDRATLLPLSHATSLAVLTAVSAPCTLLARRQAQPDSAA